jgi:hypothetical protein
MCMAPKKPLQRAFRITWENGNVTTTRMNATIDEARAYYVGKPFQFGDAEDIPGDLMVKAVTVEELHSFHVFGSYWKDLDNDAIYSEHIHAAHQIEALLRARNDIMSRSCGLDGGQIEAYIEGED